MHYKEIPFSVEIPISMFEKASAPKGQSRRIGGIISTEDPDQEGDTILQRGLDFSYFLKNGWFNDNHDKKMNGVLGYPESVKQFQKGEKLPDGTIAKSACTWAEGYLLDNWKPADEVWELGQALSKTNRRLGYSVEGKIQRRTGDLRKTIANAVVKNVAITHCPVNDQSALQILAKSLHAAEAMDPGALDSILEAGNIDQRLSNIEELLNKALAMGTPSNPPTSPTGEGPKTGEGAGQVLTPQSLLKDDEDEDEDEDKKKETLKYAQKSLSAGEAIGWIQQRIPSMSLTDAGRFVEITKALKRRGKLGS